MMRRILPTIVSRRCGFCLTAGFDEFARPAISAGNVQNSPIGRARFCGGVENDPPIGCDSVLSCRRITSRAVPSKVVSDVFLSVHSTRTASRCVGPGVSIGGVMVYPSVLNPGKFALSGREEPGKAGSSIWMV